MITESIVTIAKGTLESVEKSLNNGWSWIAFTPIFLAVLMVYFKVIIKEQEKTMPEDILKKRKEAEEMGTIIGIFLMIIISIFLILFFIFSD